MTSLSKPVKRVSSATVREQGRPRQIVVILRPPNVIGFRAAGCRTEYQLTLEGCYTMAVRADIAARQKAKAQTRKVRRVAR